MSSLVSLHRGRVQKHQLDSTKQGLWGRQCVCSGGLQCVLGGVGSVCAQWTPIWTCGPTSVTESVSWQRLFQLA